MPSITHTDDYNKNLIDNQSINLVINSNDDPKNDLEE